MALRQIKCPHCEHDVEVDVTSVTESRECPNCGQEIVLQLTPKQKRAKRTVLMVPSVDPVEKLAEAPHGDSSGPRVLQGDVHDRMMHDPEVRRNIRRLAWGSAIVAAIIALLCVADYGGWWSVFDGASRPAARNAPTSSAAVAPASGQQQPAQPGASRLDEPTAPPIVMPPAPAAPPPTDAPPLVVTEAQPRSEEERAIEAVRDFLNAKNVDERLQLVRDVSVMEPVIRAYYARHADGPIPFTKISGNPKTSEVATIRKFEVELPEGIKRVVTVGRGKGSGDYRVDWASFVIYSAMDWNEFMEKRPTDPVFMRVLVEPGTNGSGSFADPEKYLCVKITDPLNAKSPPLYGYVQRRAPRADTLKLILRPFAGTPFPVMLMLRYPPQDDGAAPSSDQVLIEQVIGEGWLASGT